MNQQLLPDMKYKSQFKFKIKLTSTFGSSSSSSSSTCFLDRLGAGAINGEKIL
jgi:hypothetical protein